MLGRMCKLLFSIQRKWMVIHTIKLKNDQSKCGPHESMEAMDPFNRLRFHHKSSTECFSFFTLKN